MITLLLLACPVEVDTGKAAGCDDPHYAFVDDDGDGRGDPGSATLVCAGEDPEGTVAVAGDCDDDDATVFSGAEERCNEVDDDCDGEADEDAVDQVTWYTDEDGDGHGAGAAQVGCAPPGDSAPTSDDPDDGDPTTYPGAEERCDGVDNDGDGDVDEPGATGEATFYADDDGDGHGDEASALVACDAPPGHVALADDCDDAAAAVHPGADESDCADPVDYNCDGSTGYADADGDGFAACEECDDASEGTFPGATEACDGQDNDCDGDVDDDAPDAPTWYADADGDGDGAGTAVAACEQPAGHVSTSTDCDDAQAGVNPLASEACDDVDNDCDGTIDEDATDASTWYADDDGDGYGDALSTTLACAQPSGTVVDATDCDDDDPWAHPGASELCDGADDDCDGEVDEAPVSGGDPWYLDADGDGYGSASTSVTECAQPAGYVGNDTDCDDTDDAVHPGADETCDGLDEDCDGEVDEGTPVDALPWYLDYDGDGYGGDAVTRACDVPSGHVENDEDCNDTDPDVYPGAAEMCNGQQDDCSGTWSSDAGLVSFRDSAGDWSDWTGTLAAGTAAAPVALDVTESGRLNICAGTWYANIETNPYLTLEIIGPDGADLTTIDAGGVDRALYTGYYSTILVRGLTFQDGTSTFGGAVFLDYFSSVELDSCVIRDSSADYGGGLSGYFLHSSIAIRDTVFRDNVATAYGGGADLGSYGGGHSTIVITGSEFSDNAADRGGGLAMRYGTNGMELRDSVVLDNVATSMAGGAWIDETPSTFTRVEVSGNSSASGGGLRIQNGASVTLDNSTVHDNYASGEGGGIQTYAHYPELYTEIWLTDSAVYDNSAGGWAGGAALYYADTWCLGGLGDAGIFGNTAGTDADDVYFYGVNPYGDNELLGVSCDIGDPRDGTDGEVYVGDVGSFALGADADFSCGASGCF